MDDTQKTSQGGLFSMILTAQVVVIIGLLGLWAYHGVSADPQPTEPPPPPAEAPTVHDPMTRPSPTRQPTRPEPSLLEVPLPLPLSNPRLLVDKSDRQLTVYSDGRAVKIYPAAVGGNPADKVREGDRATPEGDFYVCVKNPRSEYVLSLGLSYPNREDAARGRRDGLISADQYAHIVYAIDRRRQPPWKTPLGGEIMIHGCRNGGRDTQGCIALEDDAIRELYPAIPPGTPVRIQP